MFEGFIRWLRGAPPTEDDGEEGPPGDEDAADPLDTGAAMSESPPDDAEPVDGAPTGADADDAGLSVDDLEYRIDELESDLERIENGTEATRRSQEDVAESVEELEATVRQLVGVYDQLTNDVNPFADDDSFGVVGGDRSEPSTNGTTGETADAVASPAINGASTPETAPTDDEPPARDDSPALDESSPHDDGSVTSFEDLKRATAADAAADAEDAEDTVDDGAESGSRSSESTAPERTAPAAAAPDSADQTAGTLLQSLGSGYATDVVVFEWLATLVEDSGPAGALKALDYYESVGWISPDVHESLRSALGGPALDVDVDPGQPSDVTAGLHAESYDYATQLRVLDDMDGRSVGGQ